MTELETVLSCLSLVLVLSYLGERLWRESGHNSNKRERELAEMLVWAHHLRKIAGGIVDYEKTRIPVGRAYSDKHLSRIRVMEEYAHSTVLEIERSYLRDNKEVDRSWVRQTTTNLKRDYHWILNEKDEDHEDR